MDKHNHDRVRDAITYIKIAASRAFLAKAQLQCDLPDAPKVPVIRSLHHAVKMLEEAVKALELLNKQEGDN